MSPNKLLIAAEKSIRLALLLMEREGSGICFVNEDTKLVGVLTDGDVRRGLLLGASLEDPVEVIMRREFFSLRVGSDFSEIQKNLLRYKSIPILNSRGELVDIATPSRFHQIPLVQPILDGNELEYVTDCITSGWISSQGSYVNRFEEDFAKYVVCENALAVSNGTVALHLALVSLRIGPGDEVIIPDLTFAAVINAVLYVGATPVMVDVDPQTMTLNAEAASLAVTPQTKAIIPVHLYGHPADMDKLMSLAKKYNLRVIEDCAEALGTLYENRHVGTFGDVAIFSFFGNKTITTGEGGMMLFKDTSIYHRAKILRDHGMSQSRRYWHDEVGFNYRLTNIQAAIGVAQLEKIDKLVEKKRWISKRYTSNLSNLSNVLNIQFPSDVGTVRNSYWLYTIILGEPLSQKRDDILSALKDSGVEARPVFFPLHRMPPYKKYADLDVAYKYSDKISDGGISLPSSANIDAEEIDYVCQVLKDILLEIVKK